MEIKEVTAVSSELLSALQSLVKQLNPSASELSETELSKLVSADSSRLLVACRKGEIVGSLTLVLLKTPSGLRARIEDVVVDESARGQGIGTALNEKALEIAKSIGLSSVDLTSNPRREAANRLYQSLGFKRQETNVYRFDLTH